MGSRGSKAETEEDESHNVHGIQYLPSKVKKSRRRQTKHNLNRIKTSESRDLCLLNGTATSWRSCHYPFENLVFSGGGSKGYAYIGALKALDDCGILPQIKRVAGSSVGAICGSLVAVGCSPQELADVFAGDEYYVKWMFLDQKCVGCCGVPKIWKNYGVNNASRFYKILGEYYIKKVGNADITFQQLYDTRGMELCIPVTNLTKMCSEYCHWKTTPTMPIRVAVRMSMSLPVLYEPVKYNLDGQGECVYSDGGTLDQYPIHCFDGPELELNHNTVIKEEPNTESYNRKTIGLYVISECTIDYKIWRGLFDKDIPYKPTYFPQTKLSKARFDEEYRRRKRRDPNYTNRQMSEDFKNPDNSEWLHYDTVNKEHVDITSFGKFVLTAIETLMVSQRKVHVKPNDFERTVAINCGYTGTNDYELQPADREFLIRQGYAHTKAFLRDYLAKGPDVTRNDPSISNKSIEDSSEVLDAPQVTCDPVGSEVIYSTTIEEPNSCPLEVKVEINGVAKPVGETPLLPKVKADSAMVQTNVTSHVTSNVTSLLDKSPTEDTNNDLDLLKVVTNATETQTVEDVVSQNVQLNAADNAMVNSDTEPPKTSDTTESEETESEIPESQKAEITSADCQSTILEAAQVEPIIDSPSEIQCSQSLDTEALPLLTKDPLDDTERQCDTGSEPVAGTHSSETINNPTKCTPDIDEPSTVSTHPDVKDTTPQGH